MNILTVEISEASLWTQRGTTEKRESWSQSVRTADRTIDWSVSQQVLFPSRPSPVHGSLTGTQALNPFGFRTQPILWGFLQESRPARPLHKASWDQINLLCGCAGFCDFLWQRVCDSHRQVSLPVVYSSLVQQVVSLLHHLKSLDFSMIIQLLEQIILCKG